MSTSAVTLDFSKAQSIDGAAPSAGPVTLDFSKAQHIAPLDSTTPEQSGFWDTLGREGKSLAGNIAGIPAAVYHAFADPPTQDEKEKFGENEVAGAKRVGLGIHRLAIAPVEHAADWYSDALRGKIPNAYEQALSVAPEAMGAGAAAAVTPKLAAAVPKVVGSVSDAATGTVAKAAASAVPDAVAAALKKLPVSLVQRIPYIGDVLTDVYKAGSTAFHEARKPPVYPGAPLPDNPGTFPGAPLPEHPGVFPGAPLPAHPGTFPGAPLPETPAPELLQANALGKSAPQPPPEAAALKTVPVPRPNPTIVAPEETPAAPPAAASDEPLTSPALRGEYVRGDLAGDSVLRKTLSVQDNRALLQIAKSRGIDVAQDATLKDSLANPKLVNKIIDSFSEDELANVKATNQEVQRNMHNFGDVGPEAWKTMSLKTYFPDLKIPQAMLNRTAKAIEQNYASPARPMDLLGGKQAFKQQGAWFVKSGDLPTDKWVRVTEGGISDLLDALGAKGGKGLTPAARVPAADEDLTGLLDQSVKRLRASR